MNILVCVKAVLDLSNVSVSRGQGKIFEKGKRLLNPFDEHAVELALQLRQAAAGTVTALTVGEGRDEDALRKALAMGVDRAVFVKGPELDGSDHGVRARVIAKAMSALVAAPGGAPFELVLCGERSPEHGGGQVGPALAEALGRPQVYRGLRVRLDAGQVVAAVRTDDGESEVRVPLPALVVVDAAANHPRIPKALDIMKAVKREVRILACVELGLSPEDVGVAGSRLRLARFEIPEVKEDAAMA
ncbi:MAG: electron transfer flavoprotein subunit beta/FixA family protein [Planctomycetes bacterium]|nr:electron transfer flavoprotein subunit beta/FixA family protein [Planctomycetota bacterium]